VTKTDTRQAIAAEVRAALARKQIKQSDLAEAVGMSQAALSERLRGHRAFNTDQLADIAGVLGLDLYELLRPRAVA